MSLDLLNPEDRRNFTTGPTWRLFGNVWWTKPDPLDAFADVLCWLSWVAKRCPMSEVTSVDQQAGTISVITWLGLPDIYRLRRIEDDVLVYEFERTEEEGG